MILTHISDLLKERRRVAVIDLALALDASPDALRPMLAMLERKGQVRRLPSGTSCGGGCCKCDPAAVELYEWCGQG